MTTPAKYEYRLEVRIDGEWVDWSDGETSYEETRARMLQLFGWKERRIVRREVSDWTVVEEPPPDPRASLPRDVK